LFSFVLFFNDNYDFIRTNKIFIFEKYNIYFKIYDFILQNSISLSKIQILFQIKKTVKYNLIMTNIIVIMKNVILKMTEIIFILKNV